MTAVMKVPYLISPPWMWPTRVSKFGLPTTAPSSGLMMLSVSEVTMTVKAVPMMTATARSITLPRRMKSRNPLIMEEDSLAKSTGAEYISRRAVGAWKEHALNEIGEEEEEEDEAKNHHVHQEQQDDAAVIEVPARLYAADGFAQAQEGEDRRNGQQRRGARAGKAGQPKGDAEAAEHEQVGAQQRPAAEVEDGEREDWAGQ